MPLFETRRHRLLLAATALVLVALLAVPAVLFRNRRFAPDASLDGKTYVAPSLIPGAGDGLFAARDLKKGEVIAEMGGALVFEATVPHDKRGYLIKPPKCAEGDVWPFDAIDGRGTGGLGTKINFAPRVINGVETGLQNVRGREMCRRPYIFFEATRDIPGGAELLTSYGESYDYDFMAFEAVRAHFCRLVAADCDAGFDWKP